MKLMVCRGLLFLAIPGFILWCSAYAFGQSKESVLTKEDIENIVKAEIPIGTASEQVLAVLDKHGIEHSDYIEHPFRQNSPSIYAIVRNTGRSFFIEEAVQIEFSFDSQKKLTDCKIKKVYTGP